MRALVKAKKQQGSMAELELWLQSHSKINQKMFVGLLEYVLELRGFANEKHLKTIMDVMTWAEQHVLHETYAKEFLSLREHFDGALAAAWQTVKGDVKRKSMVGS